MPRFAYLLLDLDDTLYPNTSGVWEAIGLRIQDYIEKRLSLSLAETRKLRSRYAEQFGTTLTGLKLEFDVDIEDYLDYVHDVPLQQYLRPDHRLKAMLRSIQVPRIIFTNAYRPHAERVLDCLGVRAEIDQIIDIYELEFQNKPKIEAYHRALQLIAANDPGEVVFADDRLANLDPASTLKMTTVLVGPGQDGSTHLHIDQITDLTHILPDLCRGRSEAEHAG